MTQPAAPLVFGFRTATLLIFALQGYVVAALLLAAKRNRAANRALAGLIASMALWLTPDIIGFAGFYDRWPWLTFAPFEIRLLTGPLFYLYVDALTRGQAQRGWWIHLVPAALELTYLTVCFLLPFDAKMAWADGPHERLIAPILNIARLASMGFYLVLAWRRYRAYQTWLADHVSFGADFRLTWIATFLISLGVLIALWAAFHVVNIFITPLGYFAWFWMHLAVAVVSYFLGLAGWRAADREYPAMDQPTTAAGAAAVAVAPAAVAIGATTRDGDREPALAELGRDVDRRVRAAEIWRDPQLTLGRLAERLGVSEGQLSRALNQGLGLNFNEFVNRMRVEAVTRAIADPTESRSMLAIALDSGFSSKASFNRAFKAATGATPSELRRRGGS